MLKVLAPAKINLTLEVLGKRPDGYHEVRTIIHAIDLCDVLELEPALDIQVKADIAELPTEANLVYQAARLLKEFSAYPQGACLKLTKRIPAAAGLGGGSSDAAAALRGLNKLWRLGLSTEELLPLAAKLGSDVPFFLYGGAASAEGRGEQVTPLRKGIKAWVVLLEPGLPRLPDKTRQLYTSLRQNNFTRGEFTAKMADALAQGHVLNAALVFNAFESVAFEVFRTLGDYRERFLAAGADWVHLAGSGPTLYTLIEDKQKAERLCESLTGQGLKCYLAQTLDQRLKSV
jgi:4-diphosphocytidyl-2-C-methyl-D-erythritol kinase